jgi:hypothetical protein
MEAEISEMSTRKMKHAHLLGVLKCDTHLVVYLRPGVLLKQLKRLCELAEIR